MGKGDARQAFHAAIDKTVLISKAGFTRQAIKWAAARNMVTVTLQVATDANWSAYVAGSVQPQDSCLLYCPRVLGQWFDGIRFYAAASSPTRSRRTWAGLR